MKIVNFRVDDAEHQLMQALAAAAGMSLSGYIRQHFRTRAIAEGLMPDPLWEHRVYLVKGQLTTGVAPKPEPATPTPTTPEPAAPQRTPTPAAQPQPTHNPIPNPFAHLPPVDDVMFEYPEPVDNPPPDDLA